MYLSAVDRRGENTVTDPVVTTEPTADVPEPVRKAGWVWGTLATFIATTLGVLVAVGKVSQAEADSLNYGINEVGNYLPGLVGAIVGIVGIVSGIVSHVATSEVGRRSVKPVPEARLNRHESGL
jgi:hypothetical protein